MRPTSLRELPEPPVFNHVRNSSMSGAELPNSSMKTGGASGAAGADYSHVQHPPRNNAGNKNSMAGNSSSVENKVTSHSYGYDHLHAKSAAKPTGRSNIWVFPLQKKTFEITFSQESLVP